MSTLSDCSTYYWREAYELALFHNVAFPWEVTSHPTVFYSWTFTGFVFALHITGDPGEAATYATNPPTYSTYAHVIYPRGATEWTLVGSGTANPNMRNTNRVDWPANVDPSETMEASSLGIRESATNYMIARDDFTVGVAIATNKNPAYAELDFAFFYR